MARLKAIGEEWMVFEGLGVLAILLEVRGDLEGAALAYIELITERAHDWDCRCTSRSG